MHPWFNINVALAHENEKNEQKGTRITLSATETKEIQQDLLIADIRFETEGEKSAEVQNLINDKMTKALAMAKKINDAKVTTKRYSVHKSYHRRNSQKETKWKGSQSFTIEGKNSKDILKLVGDLQAIGFALNNLRYSISRETHEQIRDSLMEKALDKLMKKAKRVAKALGKEDIEVLNINLNSGGRYRAHNYDMSYRMDKSMSAEVASAPPVAAPGQSNVSVTISATVLIKD